MAKKKGILERLKDGPVLGDGGYLLELEKRGWVRAGPFTPEVALLHPDALRELHVEFREAGADVLQALTFYASRDKLATVGLENRLEELNRAAVRIARDVAGDQCLVAGNLSLTWMYEPDSPSAADRVRKTFDEQLAVQVDEGVDFIIGETFSWLGEALIAVERAKKTGLPSMVTICFENKDETADGKSAAESAKALLDAGADIVGMNCLRPPQHSRLRLSCLSACGVPYAQRQARLHQPAGIPAGPRSVAAYAKGNGRLRVARPRNWDQLHWFLLRLSRHPR
jgi:betaine-homocysteine S-methyltransferase